ncbi:Tat pathway signal sequence domain protein [Inquilinus sp. OTU3971]|uniref:Tat pathway signal sequence domain protein n=1 Tax=Inquilinus sp. OTU3971 TaxID=3043855 RepID=UPI00313AED5F
MSRKTAEIRRSAWVRPARFFAFFIAIAAFPALAQDKPAAESAPKEAIDIELNKLEPGNNGCRAFMVMHNGTSRSYSNLQLDLVVFDPKGIIVDQLAVDMAPLSADKTMVKVFEIAGHDCGNFGRVLLNDVLTCKAGDAAVERCIDLLVPTSRAAIGFIK